MRQVVYSVPPQNMHTQAKHCTALMATFPRNDYT